MCFPFGLRCVRTEWTTLLWEVGELNVEVNAVSVLALGSLDASLHTVLVLWENGRVGWTGRLVRDGGGVATLLWIC